MDKDSIDEFLDGLNETEQDPFSPNTDDPFAPEKTEGVESTEENSEPVKPEPFHKDPKVQRYVQREIEKALKNVPTPVSEIVSKEPSTHVDETVDVLTRIIGNDTSEKQSAIRDFKRVLDGMEERSALKAREHFVREEQLAVEAEREANEQLESGFEDIEDQYHVDISSNNPTAKKTRNEFIDFVKRIAPKNAHGDITDFPDFAETFAIFQETRKPVANTKAKYLAQRSLTRSTGDTSTAPRGNSWKDVDKLLARFNS